MRSLLEYVISGKSSRKGFPLVANSKVVVEWLDNNGFIPLVGRQGRSLSDNEVRNFTGVKDSKRLYVLGTFTSAGTHWVEFGDKDWWFRLRLDDDFEKWIDDDKGMCSMRMVDLNKKDPNFTKARETTKFTDLKDFAGEIDRKLL